MSNLLVIKGANIGMRYDLGKRTTIGRAPENTIQLLDPNVSRSHCEIIQRGISYHILDLESKNGILINGDLVREKTLLRNDEVIVGGTVFLYNTDHDLKNTRFSNKRVYFTSPTDETITPMRHRDVAGDTWAGRSAPGVKREGNALEMLDKLGDIFSYSQLPLPEAIEHILGCIMQIFGAENGCLMQWDPVSADFFPLVAISDEESFAVSMNVIRAVLEEKRAVLIPSPKIDKKVVSTLRMQNAPSRLSEREVALCVPLFQTVPLEDEPAKGITDGHHRQIAGLIYLEIPEGDNLLLHDVHLLQSIGNLTQVAIEHYETLDDLERVHDTERRSKRKLIGKSAAFEHVVNLMDKVAHVDSTVLITGETGTGKEVIAREIHDRSPRKDYPFVAVNCAAIPEQLIESELFGHERGAFTGADRMRRGLIENAHGGTLLLDEVGEMALNIQTKLLRFLQEKVITRVGGHKPIQVDVRIVAATNVQLEAAVAAREFREDLWFRLNVFEIHIPPLRERREDIQMLLDHFLRHYARKYNKQILECDGEALDKLNHYDWPGNIRELQNAMERAILLTEDPVLRPEHFALSPMSAPEPAPQEDPDTPLDLEQAPTLAEAEKECILKALKACKWNQAQAANLLDIHRNTLRKKIQDYDLERTD